MFAKVNHVVNPKGKKNITSILIDENGFHLLIFVLDEGNWPSSMLVLRMTNLQLVRQPQIVQSAIDSSGTIVP